MTTTFVDDGPDLNRRMEWALGQALRPDLKILLTLLAAHGQAETVGLAEIAQRMPASLQRAQELLDLLVGKGLIVVRSAPAGWIDYELGEAK